MMIFTCKLNTNNSIDLFEKLISTKNHRYETPTCILLCNCLYIHYGTV
jgi:hypothetical protein